MRATVKGKIVAATLSAMLVLFYVMAIFSDSPFFVWVGRVFFTLALLISFLIILVFVIMTLFGDINKEDK